MDPNACLRAMLALAEQITTDKRPVTVADAEALAMGIEALHNWITRGGFLPDAWHMAQHHKRQDV